MCPVGSLVQGTTGLDDCQDQLLVHKESGAQMGAVVKYVGARSH